MILWPPECIYLLPVAFPCDSVGIIIKNFKKIMQKEDCIFMHDSV